MDTPELDQTPAPTLTERGRELIERVEALDDMPILTKIKEVTALKRDAMAWAVDMAEAIERVTPYLDEQGT